MRELEKSVERKVVQYAKSLGVESTKLNILGRRGEPDRVFWVYGGRPVLMEFKRPGIELPSKLQQRKHTYLRKNLYRIFVVNDDAQGKAIISNTARI